MTLYDEAMEIHDAFMEKQRKMYTWVDRARAVDVVMIRMEYGQSSGYSRREEQTYLVRIWLAMQRITPVWTVALPKCGGSIRRSSMLLGNWRLHLRKLSLGINLSSHHKVV
jgi:hypothetical protein